MIVRGTETRSAVDKFMTHGCKKELLIQNEQNAVNSCWYHLCSTYRSLKLAKDSSKIVAIPFSRIKMRKDANNVISV